MPLRLRHMVQRMMILFVLLLGCAGMNYVQAQQNYEGNCGADGDNLTWTLSCDSVLTISGTGAMADYKEGEAPWYPYREAIKHYRLSGSSVTNIGDAAFYNCPKLIGSVSGIPCSLVTIGKKAFMNCPQMKNFTICFWENTTIKDSAFFNCPNLGSVDLNGDLVYIGKRAFYNCTNMTTTKLPKALTYIGEEAFYNCPKVTDLRVFWTENIPTWNNMTNTDGIVLRIPCGTKELYEAADGWKDYTIVEGILVGTYGADIRWTYNICDSTLVISGTGNMMNGGVSAGPLSGQLSAYKDAIKTVIIEDGITSIGQAAFSKCSKLTSVTIPNSVTSIRFCAFYQCKSLQSITIPNSVISFNEIRVFEQCYALTDLYFSWTENVPAYYSSLFAGSSIHKTVHIPCGTTALYEEQGWANSLCSLEDHVVSGTCGANGDNLTWSLCTTDSTLTISGTGAMKDWSAESAVPWYAYKDAIRSVVINEGVTRIGSYAFKYCNKIVNVSIPSSTTSIGIWAFDQCTGVEGLHISDLTAWCIVQFESFASNPLYYAAKPDLYVNDELIVNLVIPEGVTSIYKHAFQHCSAQTITLPEGLQIIGEGNASAFAYTTISSITIPQSVTYLGRWSFTDNDNLNDIYVSWTENIPAWSNMTNKSPQSSIKLHVPCGTTSLYQAATGWKSYTIVEDMPNIKSGTYGPDNIEWSFDYCDSLLSITGNGELRCDNNNWGPNAGGINPNIVKRVFVGKGVTYLGIYTLSYMPNIEYIEVEDGHPTHRTGCNAIIRIGTEQEGDTLIFGCPHTVIPTTCTTIRGYAFWDDHLVTEMTIPSSVRQIANMQGSLWQGNNGNVFYTSNNTGEGLKDLYVEWTKLADIPEVLNNKLGDMTKVRLHVPCGTTALYKQVTGWKNFKEYIEEATSYTVTVQTATGDTSMGSVSITVP